MENVQDIERTEATENGNIIIEEETTRTKKDIDNEINIYITTEEKKNSNKDLNFIIKLFKKYNNYIKHNYIDFTTYRYYFNILKLFINSFECFLKNHNNYQNITYIYFNCIFLYCKGEFDEMLALAYKTNDTTGYISALIGFYYQGYDYNLAEEYYLKSINLNNPVGMNNAAVYYLNIKQNYELTIKYYKKSANMGCIISFLNISSFYIHNKLNFELASKYFRFAMNIDREIVKSYFHDFKYNYFRLLIHNMPYFYYNGWVKYELQELENVREIQIFINKYKIAKQFNIKSKCILCLEDDILHVDIGCGHIICINCYKPKIKCYFSYCK